MKLKIYYNPKLAKDEIYIGKNGQMRFKTPAVDRFNLEKGQRWLIGIDEDEKTLKHLYMIKDTENKGYKISGQKQHGFHINMKGFLQEVNIKIPARFLYEEFEHEKHKGIKLTLLST